jgi:chromosome segregation ATPase
VRINIDLAEIQYKPQSGRSPGGHQADIDALNARIESMQAELTRVELEKSCVEASAAGHRADFERERERCDTIMIEALRLTKVAMSARETTARLEGELAAVNMATRDDNTHYTRLQNSNAILPAVGNPFTQTLLKSLDLNAGSTQAGDLDGRAIS